MVLSYNTVTTEWNIDAATDRRVSVRPDESGLKSARKLWEFEWNRPDRRTSKSDNFLAFLFFVEILISPQKTNPLLADNSID